MGLPGSRPAIRGVARAPGKVLSLLVSAVFVGPVIVGTATVSAVVVNEVHYNPTDGSSLEFVELYNPDADEVSVAGWSFSNGIDFYFPEGATIPAGGYLIVCKDREAAAARFQLPLAVLHGNYDGKLNNAGEALALVDATGTLVDRLRYDDDPPWGSAADGDGGSLQRICVSFSTQHPGNWASGPDSAPTPLAANVITECPPPELPPPPIAINEISYHPVNDRDDIEEYIELTNNTELSVDLGG